MPALLNEETTKMWLDPNVSFAECYNKVIKSDIVSKGIGIDMYEVGTLVNKVKNQSADVILPKAELEAKSFKKGIGRFF